MKSSTLFIFTLAFSSCLLSSNAGTFDSILPGIGGTLSSILGAKGIGATSPYGISVGVDAQIAANIAIDLPTAGLSFGTFLKTIKTVSAITGCVQPSTTVIRILSIVDINVRVSIDVNLKAALPAKFYPLSSTIGGFNAVGLSIDADLEVNATVTLVTPFIKFPVSDREFAILKLEGGQFYRRINSTFDVQSGRAVATLDKDFVGTYVFVSTDIKTNIVA